MSGLAVLICGGRIEWVAAGSESKVLLSALTPLSSQPGSGLAAAGLAEEGAGEGYRHLGGSTCRTGDATGLREHLTPAVAPPAGCWYGILCWQLAGWLEEGGWQAAAGILRCHRLFTGSCYPADPSAFLLLSVPILCFLTLLPLKQTVHAFLLPLVLRDFRVN